MKKFIGTVMALSGAAIFVWLLGFAEISGSGLNLGVTIGSVFTPVMVPAIVAMSLIVFGLVIVYMAPPKDMTEEECERAGGHIPGEMTETSGRGRFGTCKRCGASVNDPEWS